MARFFYTTIENQERADGSRGLLYDHFNAEAEALAKFYTICAAAAISGIPYHSAHILRSDGVITIDAVFDRRMSSVTPVTPEGTADQDGEQ